MSLTLILITILSAIIALCAFAIGEEIDAYKFTFGRWVAAMLLGPVLLYVCYFQGKHDARKEMSPVTIERSK